MGFGKTMTTTLRHENTCVIKEDLGGKTAEAEVIFFRDQEKLSVLLNKAVKIHMAWNGKQYHGKAAGMDFFSDGPKTWNIRTGR